MITDTMSAPELWRILREFSSAQCLTEKLIYDAARLELELREIEVSEATLEELREDIQARDNSLEERSERIEELENELKAATVTPVSLEMRLQKVLSPKPCPNES